MCKPLPVADSHAGDSLLKNPEPQTHTMCRIRHRISAVR
jgi:hypothetical protein